MNNQESIETLEHVLIECEEYKEKREEMEKEMIRKTGREKWEEARRNENTCIETILGIEEEGKKCTQCKKNAQKKYGEKEKERKKNEQ